MNQTPHYGREYYTAKLNDQLNFFVGKVRTAIENNLPNINVLAESIIKGLLNRIHGWNLVNANSIRQNYPGIDLIDSSKKIGIQVTSTNSLRKVDHTLEQVVKLPDDEKVDRLHIMIISTDSPSATMKGRKMVPCFSGSEDIWNVSTLIRQMMDLETSRLVEITAYLDTELGDFQRYTEQKYLNLRPTSALERSSFVGREKEMDDILARLARGDKLIVLSGLGGMGKTELAVRFGKDYKYGAVYFVRFEDNFTNTIAKMANGIQPKLSQEELSCPAEELCAEVMEILEGCRDTDILIIDNVDTDVASLLKLMKDSAYQALRNMNLRLILTTRFDYDRSLDIHPMSNRTLYEIFDKHGVSLEESQMDALIEAVNGHTLTIDQIARLLNGKGLWMVTPEKLLAALKNNTLPNEKYRAIAMDYNQSTDQAQIYENLSVVFNVSNIPKEGKAVLHCATLLPADGMNGECFLNALPKEQHQALEALTEHGWLSAENGLLTIHPVIRLVCREELKPSDESCGNFLNALMDQFDPIKYAPTEYTQMAKLYSTAVTTLTDDEGTWIYYSGLLWHTLGQHHLAKILYEENLLALEQRLAGTISLAYIYINLGKTYNYIGDCNIALKYTLDAISILEKHSDNKQSNHIALASCFSSLNHAYNDLGDHKIALEYSLKALSIIEQVQPPVFTNLASLYCDIGNTYRNLGDYQKNLDYQLKALETRRKILPENHPDIASSYSNAGLSCFDLGKYERSIDYLLKAIFIQEKVLPENHLSLASSYNNAGLTYHKLKNYKEALHCQLNALRIRQNVLPEDHPLLAQSYNNISLVYSSLEIYQKALEFQLKDIKICEKVLPPDHPDLAISYSNVGTIYNCLGDKYSALDYHLRSLAIREKVLPKTHPHQAESHVNVGSSYGNLGSYEKALNHLKTALSIFEKTLPFDHPLIENARQGVNQYQMMLNMKNSGFNFSNPFASIIPPK